jgi:hypothetical protein
MKALCVVLALGLAGCGGGGAAPTAPGARTTPVAAVAKPVVSTGTLLYDGQAFSLVYPSGWWVYRAEQPTSAGTRTTIVDPGSRRVLIEVDVSARAPRSPRAQAASLLHRLGRGAPRATTFQGRPALRVTYRDDGLRDDVLFFADDAGQGITIRTQAPAGDHARWARSLDGARESFRSY